MFDVGANTGQFASDLFSAGFKGRLISFEPHSAAHAALQKAARDYQNWEVAPRCALGAAAGAAISNIAENYNSASLRPLLERHPTAAPEPSHVDTETTPVETLANYLEKRFSGGAPRLALMMDAQVFEGEVLDGLGAHVEQCAVVLLEMPAANLSILFTRLLQSGFCCVGLSPKHKHPRTRDVITVDGLFVRNASIQEPAFHLFTSVPPQLSGEALSQQRDVISSWRAAGFEPISVNGRSEITQLAALGLDIEIELASEDGKPFIGDILAAVKRRASTRAGIINADCRKF